MKKITIVCTSREGIKPGKESHRLWLGTGFQKNGVKVRYITPGQKPLLPDVACWGWRKGKNLLDRKHNVLVMERGYIGDRFHYTSLGFNGLNNYATFPQYKDDGGERFAAHGGVLKPWKKDGDYILILGQVIGDASLQDQNIAPWYQKMAEAASRQYRIPVYFRPHPDAARRGGYTNIKGIPNIEGNLSDSLGKALFTIAYNSNSCLDSILAGVPCHAGDKGTMAWDLCMKDISKLEYPDREKTVHRIAWTQWSPQEIIEGVPQAILKEHMKEII